MWHNFINFEPLSTFIVGLAGVGVAYKTGFLNSLFKMCTKNVSRKFITFLVVLLGVISSMFSEVGYVILIPISAIFFAPIIHGSFSSSSEYASPMSLYVAISILPFG